MHVHADMVCTKLTVIHAWRWLASSPGCLGTRLGGGKVGKCHLNEGGNPFAEDTLSSWQSCLCMPD